MIILQFLFYIFVFILLLGLFIVLIFFRSIKKMKRQFDHLGKNARPNQQQQSSNTSGETINDKRSGKQSGRRIFADNEGEYIDFEEEKP